MTEEQVDRMVRDADPYRPEVTRLDEAAQHLMDQIVAEPRGRRRRGLTRGLVAAGVAAGLIAVVAVASTLTANRSADRRAASGGYSAMVLRAAEENPRLLIDEPGWKAATVYGFAEKTGTISFRNGARELEMNWYEADQYDDYHADRLHVSKPQPVRVDGQPGDLFRYSDSDFAVMLKPRDGSFVELRTSPGWTRADFDRVLAHVVHVDVRTWLAALPPEIVTPGRVDERAAKVLAGVPLPPGFDRTALDKLGVNDAYQFGAQVTSLVGCGWIAEWLRADKAGDVDARRRAAAALRGSHDWKVLHQMNPNGDWPEVFWETADKVAAGHPPAGYKQALGCS